jgi:hypothetical protein
MFGYAARAGDAKNGKINRIPINKKVNVTKSEPRLFFFDIIRN